MIIMLAGMNDLTFYPTVIQGRPINRSYLHEVGACSSDEKNFNDSLRFQVAHVNSFLSHIFIANTIFHGFTSIYILA
jgi:hypothetical protein